MLRKPNNKRAISTRRFNSISPNVPEITTNYVPVPVIEINSIGDIESTLVIDYGQYKLTLNKLTDGNVATTMECGLHTLWTITTNYDDAKSIYNYYLKRWK